MNPLIELLFIDIFSLLLVFVLVFFILLIVVFKLNKVYQKFHEPWNQLQLNNSNLPYSKFLKFKFSMIWKNVPNDFIFKQYSNIEESGLEPNMNIIIDSYKYVASVINKHISLYNKRNISNSLNFNRLGNHYIVVGSLVNVFDIVQKAHKIDTNSLIITQSKKNADLKKLEEINTLLHNKLDDILLSFEKYPTNTTDSNLNQRNQKDRDAITAYVIDDICNQFRSKKVFQLEEIVGSITKKRVKVAQGLGKVVKFTGKSEEKEDNNLLDESKKIYIDRYIFQSIIASFIKAKQAGLEIELAELGTFFGMDGDFELMIDSLIKTKQFDFKEVLKEVEKYLLKALSLPVQKVKNPYLPSWGKEEAYEMIIKWYIRKQQNDKAKLYFDEATAKYPNNRQLQHLGTKINK